MTRKHFKELADILAHNDPESGGPTDATDLWIDIRHDLVSFCKRNNPNFDEDRFRAATEGK